MIDTYSIHMVLILQVITLCVVVLKGDRRDNPAASEPQTQVAQAEAAAATQADAAEPFAVARRERRPSWRERRRELEAKHRTERKKLEEWRD